MSWQSEFGAEFKVPAAVRALVKAGVAKDASYRNDAFPRFSASRGDREVNLWVDHPNPDKRGWGTGERGGPRFLVNCGSGHSVYYEGDSVTRAVAAFKEHAAALRPKRKPVARKAPKRVAKRNGAGVPATIDYGATTGTFHHQGRTIHGDWRSYVDVFDTKGRPVGGGEALFDDVSRLLWVNLAAPREDYPRSGTAHAEGKVYTGAKWRGDDGWESGQVTVSVGRTAKRNGAARSMKVWSGRDWQTMRLAGSHPAALVGSRSRYEAIYDRDAAAIGEELTLDEAIAAQDADEAGRVYLLHKGAWHETNRRPR